MVNNYRFETHNRACSRFIGREHEPLYPHSLGNDAEEFDDRLIPPLDNGDALALGILDHGKAGT